MSVFLLPEIAAKCGKDARSLRRWCISGRVTGAFQTPGGHWRVKADSLTMAAGFALRGVRGFSRKRNERKLTIGGGVIPPWMLERVASMKKNQRRRWTRDMPVLRVIDSMPAELVPEGIADTPFLADAVVSALAWAMVSTGELTPSANDIAPTFGMARRRFYRMYGRRLKEARQVALRFLGVTRSRQERYFDDAGDTVETCHFDYDEIDRRLAG